MNIIKRPKTGKILASRGGNKRREINIDSSQPSAYVHEQVKAEAYAHSSSQLQQLKKTGNTLPTTVHNQSYQTLGSTKLVISDQKHREAKIR